MLRLAPTQIRLGPRDLAWHKDRHEARQALRDNGQKVKVIGSPVRLYPETPDNLKLALPLFFPRPPSSKPDGRLDKDDVEDDSVISNEPVPRGSKTFWDRVLAHAGTSSEIQVQHVDRRPTIVEESKSSQGNIRSSKGSIEHVLSSNIETTEAHDYVSSSSYPYESLDDDGFSPQLQPRFSNEPVAVPSIDRGKDTRSGKRSTKQPPASHPPRIFVLTPSQEQELEEIESELRGRTPRQFSGSMELDGSSDKHRYYHEVRGRLAGMTPDLRQRVYRTRDDSVERAVSDSQRQHPSVEADPSLLTPSPPQDPYSPEISPQLPVPRMVIAMRRRSFGLPRSSLRISHAAASSSPDKQSPASPDPTKNGAATSASSLEQPFSFKANVEVEGEASALFQQPSRRRKKYRFHWKSNSVDSREVSPPSGPSQRPVSVRQEVTQGQSAFSSARLTTPSPSHSFTPSPSSTPPRRLNPHAIPFTPNNTPPTSAPRRLITSPTMPIPLTSLPLRPFSATPRSRSMNASPASPSPLARPHSASSPDSPFHHSPITPPPPPHITIYDDRFSAASQPRTPAQLSRNPPSIRPPFRASGAGIAQTAPAAHGRDLRARRMLSAHSPTRRSAYDRLENQENLGINVEAARLAQRQAAIRMRR